MLSDAEVTAYCRMLVSARSMKQREVALDALVLYLSDTGQLRSGLTHAEQDREAFAFASRRIEEEDTAGR